MRYFKLHAGNLWPELSFLMTSPFLFFVAMFYHKETGPLHNLSTSKRISTRAYI